MQNQVFADVYIAKIICHIMIYNQTEYNVLLTAWQEINMKMQVHILQSIKIIIKQEFVKIMKNQCFNWKSMFMNFQSVCRQNFKSIITSMKFFLQFSFLLLIIWIHFILSILSNVSLSTRWMTLTKIQQLLKE